MTSTESPTTAPAGTGPVPPGAAPGPGESLRTVSLPGLTLAVRGRPPSREGLPPALYVHGLGGSSMNWSALMAELDGHVDSEAVDLPGFGHSPPPDDGDYTIEGYAQAVIRYLDAAGRGPVHLFGNSLGGAVTTRVAAARPDLIATLTLVSPALPEVPPQATALSTALLCVPGMSGFFARATRDWSPERRVRGLLSLCYGDPARVTEEDLAAAAAEYGRRVELPYFWDVLARSTRGVVAEYTRGGPRSLWRQAREVPAPVLLVYGVRDKLVSYRMARRACAEFPDARLLVLPDAGHVAMMEHPEAVSRGFRELLGTGTGTRKPTSGRS